MLIILTPENVVTIRPEEAVKCHVVAPGKKKRFFIKRLKSERHQHLF